MIVASAQLNIGLLATAANTRTNVTGTAFIGLANTTVDFSGIAKAYSFEVTVGGICNFDLFSHTFSGGTYSAGTKQQELATCAGTVTTAGNVQITLTSNLFGNSTTLIAVALADTPTLWAAKVATAMNSGTGPEKNFLWTSSGASLYCTAKFSSGNDSLLNVAIANSTSAGITAAPTSANSISSVAGSGGIITDGGVVDFEGRALGTSTSIKAILIQGVSGQVLMQIASYQFKTSQSGVGLCASSNSDKLDISSGNLLYFDTNSTTAGGSVVRVTVFES